MTAPLQMQSTIRADGTLEVSLAEVEVPVPGPDDVVVRVEASPINPSDLGLLFGPADPESIAVGGTAERPILTAQVPQDQMASVSARIDQPMPVGMRDTRFFQPQTPDQH